MTPTSRLPAPRRSYLPILGFGSLIAALIGLMLMFEEPRLALSESLEDLTAASTAVRTVYVETDPVSTGVSLQETGGLSLRFRIGLPGRNAAKQFKQVAPIFYGEMLRDFSRDPVAEDAGTGRLDLAGIEARVQGVLEGLLGDGVVRTVRVTEVRRRPI